MKKYSGFSTYELLFFALVLVASGGWIANIVKLVSSNFEPVTGLLIVRVAGIFVPPLGVVMGFL